MQTQSHFPLTSINGCPRRMITDRTYLKTGRGPGPLAARMRMRDEGGEAALQIDTIIIHGSTHDRVQ